MKITIERKLDNKLYALDAPGHTTTINIDEFRIETRGFSKEEADKESLIILNEYIDSLIKFRDTILK